MVRICYIHVVCMCPMIPHMYMCMLHAWCVLWYRVRVCVCCTHRASSVHVVYMLHICYIHVVCMCPMIPHTYMRMLHARCVLWYRVRVCVCCMHSVYYVITTPTWYARVRYSTRRRHVHDMHTCVYMWVMARVCTRWRVHVYICCMHGVYYVTTTPMWYAHVRVHVRDDVCMHALPRACIHMIRAWFACRRVCTHTHNMDISM